MTTDIKSRTLNEIGLDIEAGKKWPYTLAADQFECSYKSFIMFDENSGEIATFDCKQWKCPVHGPQLLWRWKQRIGYVPWQLFLTLTLVPEDKHQAAAAWTEYIRVLRRDYGVTSYLRTLELGSEGGMRHYHVLLHGSDYIDADRLRALSERVGFGKRTHITAIHDTAGVESYVTKTLAYVLKEVGIEDVRTKGWRRVTCSRNLPSWESWKAAINPLAPDPWMVNVWTCPTEPWRFMNKGRLGIA